MSSNKNFLFWSKDVINCHKKFIITSIRSYKDLQLITSSGFFFVFFFNILNLVNSESVIRAVDLPIGTYLVMMCFSKCLHMP